MPDAAVVGHPRQCRQPVERDHPLYPPGMARKAPLEAGEYALAAAFGPGFSAEFLLLQWT